MESTVDNYEEIKSTMYIYIYLYVVYITCIYMFVCLRTFFIHNNSLNFVFIDIKIYELHLFWIAWIVLVFVNYFTTFFSFKCFILDNLLEMYYFLMH